MPWFPRSSDLVSCWASSKRDSHVSSHGFPQLLESHSRLQHFHEEMVSLAECSGCHRGTGCIYETISSTTQSHGCHVKEVVFLRPQNLKLNMTRCCVRWGCSCCVGIGPPFETNVEWWTSLRVSLAPLIWTWMCFGPLANRTRLEVEQSKVQAALKQAVEPDFMRGSLVHQP